MTVTPQKTYTRADLLHQLAQLRAPRDRIVLMHSSLRLIGPIEGGAEALLDVLIDYFAASGGLFCIPTHTWANISHPERITLDVTDPHTCLGALSDLAVADSRGIRSQNPTHSMVVFGDRERAEAFIRDETNVPSGTAPNSCYGKLYEQGGYVLGPVHGTEVVQAYMEQGHVWLLVSKPCGEQRQGGEGECVQDCKVGVCLHVHRYAYACEHERGYESVPYLLSQRGMAQAYLHLA